MTLTIGQSCVLNGLGDALLDAEVWRLNLTLGDLATSTPFDLTGSDILVTFRTIGAWSPVATCSTAANDGTLTITDAPNGKVALVSAPSTRDYRVATAGFGFLPMPVQVWGDVLRRLTADPFSEPESLGQIQFLIRASTTQWPTS